MPSVGGAGTQDGGDAPPGFAVEDQQQLVSINVETRRESQLASGYDFDEGEGTVLGPVIDWQPVPQRR